VWTRVEYRDIFRPEILHWHEQCAMVMLIRDPKTLVRRGEPSSLVFRSYGPQNTAG
jgi:hypothetical protein